MESGNLLEQPEEGPPILRHFSAFCRREQLEPQYGRGPGRPRLAWYAAKWDRPFGGGPIFCGKGGVFMKEKSGRLPVWSRFLLSTALLTALLAWGLVLNVNTGSVDIPASPRM